jgi:hypothetical protein
MMNSDDATARKLLHDAALQARPQLAQLQWGQGLTRDDVRQRWSKFPQALYLRLPASKRFMNGDDLLRAAANFSTRAEGEFTDVHTTPAELAEEREVMDLGGPPAYGADMTLAGDTEQSGSATDTAGLDPTEDSQSQFEPPRR